MLSGIRICEAIDRTSFIARASLFMPFVHVKTMGQRLKSMIREGQGYMEGSCQKGVTASRRNGMKMPIYLPNVCERSRTKRHLWRFMLGLCYGAWRGGFSTREAGSSKSASKCAFPCCTDTRLLADKPFVHAVHNKLP